jgi:hypothetical protein
MGQYAFNISLFVAARPETENYRSLFSKEAVLDFCSVKNEKFFRRANEAFFLDMPLLVAMIFSMEK